MSRAKQKEEEEGCGCVCIIESKNKKNEKFLPNASKLKIKAKINLKVKIQRYAPPHLNHALSSMYKKHKRTKETEYSPGCGVHGAIHLIKAQVIGEGKRVPTALSKKCSTPFDLVITHPIFSMYS